MIEAYRLANVLIQASRFVGLDNILRRIDNPILSPYSTNRANPLRPANPVTNA
jgi:hypothetical protein